MKRIFYGIGFFFAVFFLICGFLMSYQLAGLQERINRLEEESTAMGKQVSALPISKNSSLIFESYNPDSGKMEKNTYRIFSYSQEQMILRQELSPNEEAQFAGYTIRVKNDYLTVYKTEDGSFFEDTDIPLRALPIREQAEVLAGKEIKGLNELYSFLENYSS
ncbi:MAG: hypothetical protein ACI4EO_02200 [Blautia sp.]